MWQLSSVGIQPMLLHGLQGLEDKLHQANADKPSAASNEQQLRQGMLKQAGVKLQQHALGSSQQASSVHVDITAQSQSVPSADHPQLAESNTNDMPVVGDQPAQGSPQAQQGGLQPKESMWSSTQRLLVAVAASILCTCAKLVVESFVLTGIRRHATKLLQWAVATHAAVNELFAQCSKFVKTVGQWLWLKACQLYRLAPPKRLQRPEVCAVPVLGFQQVASLQPNVCSCCIATQGIPGGQRVLCSMKHTL